MSYKVIAIPPFQRDAKKLRKKHHSLEEDVLRLIDELEQNLTPPTLTPSFVLMSSFVNSEGLVCKLFKIRMAISSKGVGKSGGARVIICFIPEQETIYLLKIYDKNETTKEPDKNELIEEIKKMKTSL